MTPVRDRKWTPANAQRPCSRCGARKRCQEADDGAQMCYGGPFDGAHGPHQSEIGEFWIGGGDGLHDLRPAPAPRGELAPAQLSVRYAELLSHLDLASCHHRSLREKGLLDRDIARLGIKTLGRDRQQAAQRVADLYPDWRDIPGFYEDNAGRPNLAGSPGYLIPCWDLKGRIVAIQIRKDDESGGKSEWFSSTTRGGRGPGAQFSFYAGSDGSDRLRITEGNVKAYKAAVHTGVATISAPGVALFGSERLLDLLLELSCLAVVLAPDADFRTNENVFLATQKAIVRLQAAGFKVEVEVWNCRAKGIDDAIREGLTLECISPESFLKMGQTRPAAAVATGWPTPDPFSVVDEANGQLGVPLWVLPEPLRHTVESIAGAKQVTTGTVVASLLGLLSAVCAGRYCARLAPQYTSHSFLWILLSLRSSGGKSEALSVLSEAVFQAEKRLRAEAQTANDTNASERARLRKGIALLDAGAAEDYPGQLSESRELLKKVEVREACRFIRHDVSPQKIGVLYAQHQRVSIVSAESADWLSLIMGYGKDSGAMLSSCLSGFSVEPYGEDRITREESHCNRPVLSLLLACQEDEVKSFLSDPVARRRGFLGRTLIFQGDSLVGKRLAYDQRPGQIDLACWNTLVRTVTEQTPESDEDGWLPIPIPVEEEARKLFCRIFEVTEKRLGDDSPDLRLGEFEEVAGRSMEQVGRLALLVHVLWTASRGVKPNDEAISAGSVVRGFALMLWALQGFLELSGPRSQASRQNLALDLWQELRTSPLLSTGSCTVKDWQRLGANRWRGIVKLEPQLAILREMGYLDVISRKNQRGPVSRVIELNPSARDREPEIVATVATVWENPLFIEVIQAQPHLRRYCDGMP